MSDVNKQLLDALSKIGRMTMSKYASVGEAMSDAKRIANEAIAAAEAAQRAEPVAWQFYEGGKWWNGDDRIKDHRKNTEESGIPTRDLYAQPPAVAVPDGYALVPIEPTPEMVAAGAEGDSQFYDHARFVYCAMIAVAQNP